MSIPGKFSDCIYQYRMDKHLSQRAMAELCGVSWRHYHDLEMGFVDPALSTAVRISAVLDFSLDTLKSEVNSVVPLPRA